MKKVLVSLFALLTFFIAVDSVSAQSLTLTNPLTSQTIGDLIAKITVFVSQIVGALAVLMLVWAGILFVASGGNEQRLSSAKKAAIWAVIGLAIALAGTGLTNLLKTIIGA